MAEKNGSRTAILLALIAAFSGICAAVISNWDKLFNQKSVSVVSEKKTSNHVRTDGLYMSPLREQAVEFLRFYDDGTVVGAVADCSGGLTDTTIHDVGQWLTKDTQFRGRYKYVGDSLKFSIGSLGAIATYNGVIDDFGVVRVQETALNGNTFGEAFSFTDFK